MSVNRLVLALGIAGQREASNIGGQAHKEGRSPRRPDGQVSSYLLKSQDEIPTSECCHIIRSAEGQYRARIMRLRSLPVGRRGKSSTKSTLRGHLYFARRC